MAPHPASCWVPGGPGSLVSRLLQEYIGVRAPSTQRLPSITPRFAFFHCGPPRGAMNGGVVVQTVVGEVPAGAGCHGAWPGISAIVFCRPSIACLSPAPSLTVAAACRPASPPTPPLFQATQSQKRLSAPYTWGRVGGGQYRTAHQMHRSQLSMEPKKREFSAIESRIWRWVRY